MFPLTKPGPDQAYVTPELGPPFKVTVLVLHVMLPVTLAEGEGEIAF